MALGAMQTMERSKIAKSGPSVRSIVGWSDAAIEFSGKPLSRGNHRLTRLQRLFAHEVYGKERLAL